MTAVFYISAIVAIAATAMVITQSVAIHALLYLIVSLLAIAIVFFTLGAPLIAALEVIIYAGAIMVLFVFVIMLLNIGVQATDKNDAALSKNWIGPGLLALILAGELAYIFSVAPYSTSAGIAIGPETVGIALFGTYLLGVELTSVLLLVGLIGAYHLGRRAQSFEKGEVADGHDSP